MMFVGPPVLPALLCTNLPVSLTLLLWDNYSLRPRATYCRLSQCHISVWLAVKLVIVQIARQMDMIAHILLSLCNICIRTVVPAVWCLQVKMFCCGVHTIFQVTTVSIKNSNDKDKTLKIKH